MTTGGVMIGLLVSSTTFSGHLRADLIRMVALSMISGRSGKHHTHVARQIDKGRHTAAPRIHWGRRRPD